jgi:hypothetical protein
MTFVDILAHLCILRRRAAGNRPLEIELDRPLIPGFGQLSRFTLWRDGNQICVKLQPDVVNTADDVVNTADQVRSVVENFLRA